MKPGAMWPFGIASVLGLTVAANVALFYVAGRDPSFVIEPNYYAKAVAWDSTLAQSRRNDALGWSVTPTLAPFSARDGARLSIALTDSAGQAITGAVVKVAALYNARAGTVLEAVLTPERDGYSTRLAVTHGGQWELRFDVTRGPQRFTAIARIDAVRETPHS